MSKAFTKEEDPAVEELPDEAPPQLPPGTRNYITAAGARRLQAEHERLQGERAALREGGAPEGGPALRALDHRLRQLSLRLGAVEVVRPAAPGDRVVFGSTVILRDEEDRQRRYRIVGLYEVDPRRGDVSWLSPLGQAVLNARVGDTVTVRTPRGVEELAVEAVAADATPDP
jgi:transcription elongation factor GreB